jgi:hypothetical protein
MQSPLWARLRAAPCSRHQAGQCLCLSDMPAAVQVAQPLLELSRQKGLTHAPHWMQATPCEVHTFDCTYDGKDLPEFAGRHHYHKTCVGHPSGTGSASNANSSLFMTYPAILAQLGHSHVDLLKIDIEGGSWHGEQRHHPNGGSWASGQAPATTAGCAVAAPCCCRHRCCCCCRRRCCCCCRCCCCRRCCCCCRHQLCCHWCCWEAQLGCRLSGLMSPRAHHVPAITISTCVVPGMC